MKLFGLTGGIACGKSTVSKLLRESHGCHIVDCDEIVRELQQPNTSVVKAIAVAFADDDVVDEHGALRRERLSAVVFADPAKRKKLGKVMNGAVFRAIFVALLKAWWTLPSNAVVVLDAPLLFETNVFTRFCSGVLVVGCATDAQVARLKSRNALDETAALQRINAQFPVEKKMAMGDFVIRNEGSLQDLAQDVSRAARWMATSRTTFTGWNRMTYGTVSLLVSIVAIIWRLWPS